MIKKIIILSGLTLFIFCTCLTIEAQSVLSLFRISVTPQGGGGDQGSRNTALSPNSELLIFESNSTNLVSSDTNNRKDIFLRNLSTNQTSIINLGKNGEQANQNSQLAAVSAKTVNGLFAVVYESLATNLTRLSLSDANGKQDIYFSIPAAGSSSISFTERASLGFGPGGFGSVESDGDSFRPSVAVLQNPDRILVAYSSDATNLVSGDTNNKRDVFLTTIVRPSDLSTFDPKTMISTIRVSNNSTLGESDGNSDNPQISGDGKSVVYVSDSTKLVTGVTSTAKQIYLLNTDSNVTTLISKASDGTAGLSDSASPSVNYNGKFIAYLTKANNIVADGLVPNSQTFQVIFYNLAGNQSERVNVSSTGALGNSTSDSDMSVKISPDGTQVTFSDSSSNLADKDDNSNTDVFIKDMQTGSLQLVSRALSGNSAAGQSTVPVLGGLSFNNANAILPFTTTAGDMVTDDDEGQTDAYISQFSIPLFPLIKNEAINVPPDITVSGKKYVARVKAFSGVAAAQARIKSSSAKKSKPKIRYLVRTFIDDPSKTKKKLVKQILSKKTAVATNNLKPGNYISNYQAQIVVGDKVKGKSGFSPDQRFTIN